MTSQTPGQPAPAPLSGLVPVLPQHRFDEPALAHHLRGWLPAGFDGRVVVQQFRGGQSNPTFHLATNVGELVLRKKPPGKLLPSAHAVEREYRVIAALAGTHVPVPAVLGLCEDASVIGTAFFVMRYVPGRVLGERLWSDGVPAERAALFDDLARVLAALHRVDFRARGLEDFGRPARYLQRQVERWAKQWDASKLEECEEMERLREWLPSRLPTDDEAAIAHGDYRLGNVLVAPDAPRVAAVLDWELATLGHPLSDLAYFCLAWRVPPELGGLAGVPLEGTGMPSEREFVERYCRYAQRPIPGEMDVLVAFSLFRLAAISAGVYRRGVDGIASDPRALLRRDRYRLSARVGWEIAQRSGR